MILRRPISCAEIQDREGDVITGPSEMLLFRKFVFCFYFVKRYLILIIQLLLLRIQGCYGGMEQENVHKQAHERHGLSLTSVPNTDYSRHRSGFVYRSRYVLSNLGQFVREKLKFLLSRFLETLYIPTVDQQAFSSKTRYHFY